jgi:uncharacterized protein (DUF2062 family)
MLNLNVMLPLIAGGAGFLCAIMEGKKNGDHGVVLGIVVGLAVGFIGFLGLRMLTAKKVIDRILLFKKVTQYIVGYMGIVVAIVWVIFCGFLGSWLTKSAIHLLK